jgi:hypothetical protein
MIQKRYAVLHPNGRRKDRDRGPKAIPKGPPAVCSPMAFARLLLETNFVV